MQTLKFNRAKIAWFNRNLWCVTIHYRKHNSSAVAGFNVPFIPDGISYSLQWTRNRFNISIPLFYKCYKKGQVST